MNPQPAGSFFARFLKTAPSSRGDIKVRRESKNTDLLLTYSDGQQLIIENKVKSIPSEEQLRRYSAKSWAGTATSFLLLTLIPPPFGSLSQWNVITYRQLAAELKQILPRVASVESYHGLLLGDYINFIERLSDLGSLFAINWDDEDADFFIDKHLAAELTEIRLHDLVDKLRYSALSERVGEILRDDRFNVKFGKLSEHADTAPGSQVLLNTELTNATGLTDCKYVWNDVNRPGASIVLGVQLQGNDFRITLETKDKDRAEHAANALWEALERIWFDFALLERAPRVICGSIEYPTGEKKVFNRFSGDFIFLYRSRRLGRSTAKGLADVIAAYARLVRDNEEEILKQLEDRLSLQAGIDDMEAGCMRPLEEVDAEIRAKHGFPPDE